MCVGGVRESSMNDVHAVAVKELSRLLMDLGVIKSSSLE